MLKDADIIRGAHGKDQMDRIRRGAAGAGPHKSKRNDRKRERRLNKVDLRKGDY